MIKLIEITLIVLAVLCIIATGCVLFGFYKACEDYKVRKQFYDLRKRYNELNHIVNE